VRSLLRSREIDLPTGAEGEGADAWSVSRLAAKKNEILLDILAERGVLVFPGTEALLQRPRDFPAPSFAEPVEHAAVPPNDIKP